MKPEDVPLLMEIGQVYSTYGCSNNCFYPNEYIMTVTDLDVGRFKYSSEELVNGEWITRRKESGWVDVLELQDDIFEGRLQLKGSPEQSVSTGMKFSEQQIRKTLAGVLKDNAFLSLDTDSDVVDFFMGRLHRIGSQDAARDERASQKGCKNYARR